MHLRDIPMAGSKGLLERSWPGSEGRQDVALGKYLHSCRVQSRFQTMFWPVLTGQGQGQGQGRVRVSIRVAVTKIVIKQRPDDMLHIPCGWPHQSTAWALT